MNQFRSLVIRQIRKRKRNLLKERAQRVEVEGVLLVEEPHQRNLLLMLEGWT
jgi:hypothetical protein